jgi:5'-3' exonuclease
MTILALDFMNAAHRARSGFLAGDYPVVFNFFRGFRALVEQFKPNRVYVALEGRPHARHALMGEYKANRVVAADDPRAAEMANFFRQVDIIKELLNSYFPVSVVRHPDFEADDTIANLISRSTSAVPWVLVSSDTDFIQLLQTQSNLRLYNPVRKEFVEAPADYDYVTWKALRGDATDNIPGVPGVGDKTADKIASDPDLLTEYVSRPEVEPIFTRNYDLIRFAEWNDDERGEMTSSSPTKDWDTVKSRFSQFEFASIVKDGTWQKFVGTFDKLWGV